MKKKKIALVVDVENWAYHHIALEIQEGLKNKYHIDIIFRVYVENIVSLVYMTQDYDLIHFFWRGDLYLFDGDFVKYYVQDGGMELKYFKEKYLKHLLITTSVYDHLFLDKKEIDKTKTILDNCFGYTVCSKKLFEIYNERFIKKPDMEITDGVNLDKFFPIDTNRFELDNIIKKEKIFIGWVGNSSWEEQREDMKGVNTILKPALADLKSKGYKIEELFADKQIRMIPHNQMNEYYSKIDILICTSKIEGTPNPILEAMACGIPVISTDVGIVPELFGEKQQEFILEERNIECLKKKILFLLQKPSLFEELSKENINKIKQWNWKNKIKEFDDFFTNCFQAWEDKNEQ